MAKVVCMDHPLIQHKVGILRRKELGTKEFRALVSEIAMLMCYEATRDLELADVEIFSEDVPGWTVANEGALTVALDVEVTDALRREGVAREIVKKIQAVRKDSGFDITDRISVVVSGNEVSNVAVEEFKEYICNQVLADKLVIGEVENGEDVELDGYTIKVSVERI